MKKGFAVEGFIEDDGTIKPLEKYDDTELRAKIQKNVDEIDNLKSSVQGLGTSKADKVHSHSGIEKETTSGKAIVVTDIDPDFGGEVTFGVKDAEGTMAFATIGTDNIGNLERALKDPSTTPENDATKLITSKAVYDALAGKMKKAVSIYMAKGESSYPVIDGHDVDSLDEFIQSCDKDEWVACHVVLTNTSYENIGAAVGLASWWYSGINETEISVRVFIGAKEFIVRGQVSQDDDRVVDNWASAWARTDYSSLF